MRLCVKRRNLSWCMKQQSQFSHRFPPTVRAWLGVHSTGIPTRRAPHAADNSPLFAECGAAGARTERFTLPRAPRTLGSDANVEQAVFRVRFGRKTRRQQQEMLVGSGREVKKKKKKLCPFRKLELRGSRSLSRRRNLTAERLVFRLQPGTARHGLVYFARSKVFKRKKVEERERNSSFSTVTRGAYSSR